MELSVFERLILLNVLPKEGDLTTIRIVRKLRESLSFTEDEHAKLQFTQEGDRVIWLPGVVGDVPIEIGPKATELIRATLEGLDKQKKLTEEHLDLCDKFGVGAEG